MDSKLKYIFAQHDGKLSDKWSLYINEWDGIFSPYQDQEINLLEIGTQNGGSLEIFAKYFPKAKHIIGCDIEENCQKLQFSDPRITVITGDINSDSVENRIAELAPNMDIIIDDGSHHSHDVIQSFCRYYKRLDNHGLYLIEDLHSSYWDDYEGGLYQPYTAMSFLKRLVDITNFEHWQSHQSREEYLAPFVRHYGLDIDDSDFYQVHSIKFINSLCVIHKRPPEENVLGKRVIVGAEEGISADYRKFDGTTIHNLPKGKVDDIHLDVFSLLDQNKGLETELYKRKQTVQQLQAIVTEQKASIQALKAQVDEEQQTHQQMELTIAEQEQTLHQFQIDLLERDQDIQKLNVLIGEQAQIKTDLEAELKQQDQILHQLQNEVTANNQLIHEYHQKIQSLNQQVLELKHEILFYALSKSWRFTRPLRKLLDRLRGKRHA